MDYKSCIHNIGLVAFIVFFSATIAACSKSTEGTNTSATLSEQHEVQVVPMPAHVESFPGAFSLKSGSTIYVKSHNKKAIAVAKQFINLVEETSFLRLNVKQLGEGETVDNAIVLHLAPNAKAPDNKEGYRLTVDKNNVHINARTPAGLYYATVTLWELMTTTDANATDVKINNVSIKDQPRFKWRGIMLDSARHFQTVAQIKKLIDWMSLHKLNVLHWHLSDDQGWRLQIKQYPKLTQIGSCRQAIGPDIPVTGSADTPYCGYYTQDQARAIVRYAAKHFITVVPEIEVPGHAQAALATYPQLGVTGKRPAVQTKWGIFPWLYAPNKKSITFLENVLDEVMAIFPSKYIHIGGDEADKAQWKASAVTQAKRKKLGLDDMDKLQGWMTDKIGQYLADHGRTMIGWDEILQGGHLPQSAIIMSWRGIKGGITAAKKGHDTILSPSPRLYFDYPQATGKVPPSQWDAYFDVLKYPSGAQEGDEDASAHTLISSLKGWYTFNPIPSELNAKQAQHILGVQGNLWTEYKSTFMLAQKAYFPRMAALAEVAWSPESAIDWQSFLARMPAQLLRYKRLGIDYSSLAWRPNFKLTSSHGKLRLTLKNQTHSGIIRYTTDATMPTPHSKAYTKPLVLSASTHTVVTAATYSDKGLLLAKPRSKIINSADLFTRHSYQLSTCSKKDYGLNMQAGYPINGIRPVYRVNPLNTCWLWKNVKLNHVHSIVFRLGSLPWRTSIKQSSKRVKKHPHQSAHGDMQVHLDSCSGPMIAHVSLDSAAGNLLQTQLRASMKTQSGKHTLCIIAAGKPKSGRFWALDTVRLLREK